MARSMPTVEVARSDMRDQIMSSSEDLEAAHVVQDFFDLSSTLIPDIGTVGYPSESFLPETKSKRIAGHGGNSTSKS